MKAIICLFADKFQTEFMQSCDVFESGKVIIREPILGKVEDDFSENEAFVLRSKSKDEPYELIAVFDRNKIYYRDFSVKTISTGRQWTSMDNYIAYLKGSL